MQYDVLAARDVIERTILALKSRNILAQLAEAEEQALALVKDLIPANAEVMTGGSRTLEQIGLVELLKTGSHPWRNLKDTVMAEPDPAKQVELRRRATLARFFLGSVHAITHDGRVAVASYSGSQIPSYAYNSPNVIWVAGAQKIVPTLDDAFQRIREYSLPLEDQRVKALGGQGSAIAKILIVEREVSPFRKVHLVLVNRKLGF